MHWFVRHLVLDAATTTCPRRELKSKLQRRLEHWKLLIECRDVFSTLNRLEFFGAGPINYHELVSLHDIKSDSSTKGSVYDPIVHYIVPGACNSVDSELCLSVHSASHTSLNHSKPVDLQLHIPDGVLKTANRKIVPHILHVLNIPRPVNEFSGNAPVPGSAASRPYTLFLMNIPEKEGVVRGAELGALLTGHEANPPPQYHLLAPTP